MGVWGMPLSMSKFLMSIIGLDLKTYLFQLLFSTLDVTNKITTLHTVFVFYLEILRFAFLRVLSVTNDNWTFAVRICVVCSSWMSVLQQTILLEENKIIICGWYLSVLFIYVLFRNDNLQVSSISFFHILHKTRGMKLGFLVYGYTFLSLRIVQINL